MKANFLFLLVFLCQFNSIAQYKTAMEESKNNPLICDPVEGFCGLGPAETSEDIAIQQEVKPIKIIYFTDPICSSCWGIEAQLRKLKLEYSNSIEIEYHMGGLLPDWSYNSGGISKPADVAHHWDEVSEHYDMPIDGDVWLEDPLHSSYPPSIAFKAAQLQDNQKAILFLRAIREMVFLQKKNITKWTYLELAAQEVGLDIAKLKQDYEDRAKRAFEEDLKLGRELGVRGFPTIFFLDKEGQREIVYGSRPYETYENVILKLDPAAEKSAYDKHPDAVFSKYSSLTANEFSELTNTPRNLAEETLDKMVEEGKLEKFVTKNGSIWKLQ